LSAETNKIQEHAWGPDPAGFAEFGAWCVRRQAVPQQSKCHLPGCNQHAVVLCSDCQLGGMLLCAEHDSLQHPFAHMHCRAAVTSGFKQPLRPTQQYVGQQQQPAAGQQAAGQQQQQLQQQQAAGQQQQQQQAAGQQELWPDVVKVFDIQPCRACDCAGGSSAKRWVLQAAYPAEQRKPLIVVGQSGEVRAAETVGQQRSRCISCPQGRWQEGVLHVVLGRTAASKEVAHVLEMCSASRTFICSLVHWLLC
jgi:hypothetical protein